MLLASSVFTQVREMEFVTIPAGRFTMRTPEHYKRAHTFEKQVKITLSRAFEMMTTQVTQKMWFDVMGNNPSRFKTPNDCLNHVKIRGVDLCPDHPIENVSWNDAQTYIKRRNEAKGLMGCRGTPKDPKGCYRLPTEAEWEYAARGRTRGSYSLGYNRTDLGDYAWYLANSKWQTHPVGTKRKNPYGLHDMLGNVFEWVLDVWTLGLPEGRDPLVLSGSPQGRNRNPLVLAGSPHRVLRGGCYVTSSWILRRFNDRGGNDPDFKSNFFGFRLVRNL